MRNDPVALRLKTTDPQPLTSNKLRLTIHFSVVAIHSLLIFGPFAWLLYLSWTTPQETMFKVKLAGPLSTGEVVGPPSRLRPSNNPGPLPPAPGSSETPKPAAPPPPPVPAQTAKPTPKPTPKPPPVPAQTAKPTPKPPPVPAQTAKPAPKPPPVPKQTAKQPSKQTQASRNQQAQASRNQQAQTPAPARQLSAAEQVAQARQSAAKYGDGGGSNFNSAVPIGDADRAQAYGKQNNATPGGGGNSREEDAAYWTRLGNYVETRWTQPPGSLLGENRPTVTIELNIAADGRVTDSRIVQSSGNRAMDDSVQRMLANLDRVPAPSKGATSIQILLRTRD